AGGEDPGDSHPETIAATARSRARGRDHTAAPAIDRRAAAAAGRHPPRTTRSQNRPAPTRISTARPIQPPTAPRPQPTPSAHASGGVVSHEVAKPKIAAERTALAPRREPRADTCA